MLTNCVAQHGKSAQCCDRLREMLLGIVELSYVSTYLLDHNLALLCFPANVIDFCVELLNSCGCCAQVLSVRQIVS